MAGIEELESGGSGAGGLVAWLVANVPALRPPFAARQVGGGRSNLTYAITDSAGAEVILRRPRRGSSLKGSHNLGREHAILAAAHRAGQKVPEPLALCDDEAVIGAPFYLMAAIAGIVADSPGGAEMLDQAARGRTAAALAETLAELHAVDVGTAAFREFSAGERYPERQVERWQRQWGRTRARELAAVDRLGDRLAGSIPDQREVALVHGDFTLFNVVLDPRGEVRAVLDWEMATIGDPVADLAWCSMWWPDSAAEIAPGAEPIPLLEGFPRRERLISAYVAATGRDLASLPWWRALSYWKLAIIIEGILRSWDEDPANGGKDPGSLRPGVLRAVRLGETAAQEAGI